MRIAIAIASRGRPSAMAGVVMSFWRLQSGRNELAFPLAIDDDDVKTIQMARFLQEDEPPVVLDIAPRPGTLAECQNRAIKAAAGSDVVVLASDRTFCITPGFDEAIANAVKKYPNRVMWFSSPTEPDLVLPIIPKAFLDAVAWDYAPVVWPFWFIDTWHVELDRLIHGGPSLRVKCMYSGGRAKTTRGRDFEFWIRLFVATRKSRIKASKILADTFGVEWKEPDPAMIAEFEARDKYQLDHVADFEKAFGDPSDPGPEYVAAKARAEKIMEALS